jgi:DNA-binding transcriptional MerR regulator
VVNEHGDEQRSDLVAFLAAKPFLKIGEVARIIGVKPHVLRYWESEFPSLRPKKNPSGQRIYARSDVEAIVEIKNLLYNERYTISGAKRMLAQQSETLLSRDLKSDVAFVRSVSQLKAHVNELITMLETPKA